jgi:hypothetical protein
MDDVSVDTGCSRADDFGSLVLLNAKEGKDARTT